MKNKYITIKESRIHHRGVFAKIFIKKSTLIIEYVGEKITKREAERRGDLQLQNAGQDQAKGHVYIFELNKCYDIDGNVSYNDARFINHSCDPNCEAVNIDGHIWIEASKDIPKGEELTYNYGYQFSGEQEHECFCGSRNCVGYIIDQDQWHKLEKWKYEKVNSSRNR